MYNSNQDNFLSERYSYIQANLSKGIAFEKCVGSFLTNIGNTVSYPNTAFASRSDLFSISNFRYELVVRPDIYSCNKSTELFIECSWRECGYLLYCNNYVGIPYYKFYNYLRYRTVEVNQRTLIVIGHSGTPNIPQCVFITELTNFYHYGQRIHYKPFEHNPAKHSPDQQVLHLNNFHIFDNGPSLINYLRGL